MSPDDNRITDDSTAKPCPICGRPSQPSERPFCSKRCAMIDLNRWLGGNYRIPTEEPPESSDTEQPPD